MEDITPEDSVVSVFIVPLTEEEIAHRNSLEHEASQREIELQSKLDARESALAKLAKLGLTEEEAKAVIGL